MNNTGVFTATLTFCKPWHDSQRTSRSLPFDDPADLILPLECYTIPNLRCVSSPSRDGGCDTDRIYAATSSHQTTAARRWPRVRRRALAQPLRWDSILMKCISYPQRYHYVWHKNLAIPSCLCLATDTWTNLYHHSVTSRNGFLIGLKGASLQHCPL